jgi:hypothetical protein
MRLEGPLYRRAANFFGFLFASAGGRMIRQTSFQQLDPALISIPTAARLQSANGKHCSSSGV